MRNKHFAFSLFLIVVTLLATSLTIVLAQEPTLLTDELGTAEDLVPTQDEIDTALTALGEDGFIGIIACTYSSEYHFTVADMARQRAEELGLRVDSVDSEVDVEKQISAIENFVSSGADVIIICLFDPPSVQSALEEAAAAGVYIVQYAGRQLAEIGGVTISIEDADLGAAAGQYAGELINAELGGQANVAILDYPDVANVVVRADAIRASLLEVAPEAVVVGNYLGGTTENGLTSMETALQEHPEINVVVSINDAGAYGAMQALEAAGHTAEDTIIVGIDAEEQARTFIGDGTMYRGTVDTSPAETGVMAVNAAVKLLAGSTLPQNVRVPVTLITIEDMTAPELGGEPTLLTDELGTAEDLVPTQDEIDTALTALGEDGFIGIIACTYSSEYHFTVADMARQRAEELGLRVDSVDSEVDVEKQISAIENFVSSGADVIIICLFDPPSVQSALEEAAAAGVYIVQYAGRQLAEIGGVTISIEDADLGAAAGQYAGELINAELGGQANVAILDYPDVANVVVRADAIRASLLEVAPEAVVVGNYLGGTTENGLTSMETALQEHPEINVVVSINDAGAYGAMQALEAAGHTAEDTIIVGIDAEEQARTFIGDGTMYRGTVDTSPAETGVMAVNAAVKLLAGSTLPQNVRVPVTLITADNVE